MKKYVLLTALIVVLALVAVQCGSQSAPEAAKETVVVKETVIVEKEVEVVVTKEVEVAVEVTPEPDAMANVEVPFLEMWANSPHADASSEAFRHWDADDPAEVPTGCAKCHSGTGYMDFLGADGSAAGSVENAAPIDTVINCVACHNSAAKAKTSVVFPSGVEITGLGAEARCMECHQGRASKLSVDSGIETAGLTDMDTISADLGFTNIHYFAAAATQAGGTAMGGYEYEGKVYDAKFAHVAGYDSCVGCHNSHTLEVKVSECQTCHTGVTAVEDLKDLRWLGSKVDYDGDGDMEEGIYYEIEGLQGMLYEAMQAYSGDVAGSTVVYDSASYPYFFDDAGEAYASWTGRLAKAAYNYQTSLKDPGAFAHGGKYIIQLLYDSIEDLNVALSAPVDLSNARRIDHGHFAGSEEAFRHWDAEGEVAAGCAKCHSAEGLPLFAKEGVNIAEPLSNGLTCTTCHVSVEGDAPRLAFEEVEFPSGLVVTAEMSDENSLICMNCHQGRESSISISKSVDGLAPDTVSDKLRFLNVHYFAAGATRYGTQAQGAFEYPGQGYNGFFEHTKSAQGCTDCHGTHTLEVNTEKCADCHVGVEGKESLMTIRESDVDFDGDGDVEEGMAGEVSTIHEALYAAMQAYAAETAGAGLIYESHSYPYFFTDTNGNGEADADEVDRANGFASWTPTLLQAAYNYQYVAKDPGAFAHNGKYVIQVLYDSLESVGGNVSSMTRPDVE